MDLKKILAEIDLHYYDKNYIQELLYQNDKFYALQARNAKKMFGYPANLKQLSELTKYLFLKDISYPLANNCGDNYERGNYQMDSKDVEIKIIELFAKKFGAGENYWGYITSGGSESNFCGIDTAFLKQPNGILYFSQSAHYSIVKQAKHYSSQVILNKDGDGDEIDDVMLCKMAQSNYETLGHPANIVLTFGTTKYGSCDNIDAIVSSLAAANVPFYIHVDAALFGGIPNNQEHAPKICDMLNKKINSISVSFHKYFGFPEVKSLFLTTEKPLGKYIPYIGHSDTTTAGSRSIPPFALYNHLIECLEVKDTREYVRNILVFENMLKCLEINYYRAPLSNIFVIDSPNDTIVKEYQLSTFIDRYGNKKAHIIIFPYHNRDTMLTLANSIKYYNKFPE